MIIDKFILTPLLVWAVFYPANGEETATCHSWAGTVIAFQGTVEQRRLKETGWRTVHLGTMYCPGDRIRTLDNGHALILLADNTHLELKAWTTITFLENDKKQKTWYERFKGLISFPPHNPLEKNGNTLFVNAAFWGLLRRRRFK